MIRRDITPVLVKLFGQYPVVTVTGPRQSGKTTLCRETFPDLAYVNLEAHDQREFAERDPQGFLAQVGMGSILDEIQRVPSLLSYIQVAVDEERANGLFVLTGSQQFRLTNAISQSLAGRTALLRLLPFSLAERRLATPSDSVDDLLYSGFYPRVFDQSLEPRQAYADYFETYVERDVRQLAEIRNLSSFQRFVRLCAGRVGQLTNLSSLGADAGVSHVTARQWLTLLEASYVVRLLRPYHANIRKRLIKSPKLYFYDVGLACHLLGIEHAQQVTTHPLRGPLFENMVVIEALKHRFNRGRSSNLSFFRDKRGLECDLLFRNGNSFAAIEIKSGATITSDFFSSFGPVSELVPNVSTRAIVYGGRSRQSRSAASVVPLADFDGLLDRLEADEELAALVRERTSPAPDVAGVAALDLVFRVEIRPALDRLESSLRKQLAPLFRSTSSISYVATGRGETNSSGLLERAHWERTKEQYVVTRGFALRDEPRLELRHEFQFTDYTGQGSVPFDLSVSIAWKLGAGAVTRTVAFDRQPVAHLEARTAYADLEEDAGNTDRTVADIQRLAIQGIKDRAGN
ncbi:MAG: ATP-binding protein [Chloroflexi bacterium]|nr:ATP-binding protein [Chloroflexota bacterium]